MKSINYQTPRVFQCISLPGEWDLLLDHPHDLIHKAVGWLLREAGKRNISSN